jgi:hypothetical protein
MVRDLKGRIASGVIETGYACRIHLPIDHTVSKS